MGPTRPKSNARAVWNGAWRTHRHRRSVRLGAAAIVALLATTITMRAEDAAERTRDQWTSTTTAWTAAHDLAAGTSLTPADLVTQPLPHTALPVDAVLDPPVGEVLLDDLATGEIVREGRLRGPEAGSGGALRLTEASPHLEPGDRVDLYRLLDGQAVARGARVVAVDADGIPVVQVATAELPAVIASLTTGSVVPVTIG